MVGLKYEDAGVNIDAGNETVERIKKHVKTTFSSNVLTGLGAFGSLYSLKDILNEYEHPILVQSCLLYTSPSPRDQRGSRMPSSA